MSSFPYLIAIALINQSSHRSLPLNGRSSNKKEGEADLPEEKAQKIVLELLIRVFQRTGEITFTREAGDKSLILIEINLESMQKELPFIKAEWIDKGDTELLLRRLQDISNRVWSVNYRKQEGIIFNLLVK